MKKLIFNKVRREVCTHRVLLHKSVFLTVAGYQLMNVVVFYERNLGSNPFQTFTYCILSYAFGGGDKKDALLLPVIYSTLLQLGNSKNPLTTDVSEVILTCLSGQQYNFRLVMLSTMRLRSRRMSKII